MLKTSIDSPVLHRLLKGFGPKLPTLCFTWTSLLCAIFILLFFGIFLLCFWKEVLLNPFSYTLVILLFLVILFSYLILPNKDGFEPFFPFSFYYSLFIPGALYLLINNFEKGVLLDYVKYYSGQLTAFNISMVLLIIGYGAFCCGYLLAKPTKVSKGIVVNSKNEIDPFILRLTAIIALSIGLANFLFVAYSVSGGILPHLLSIASRGRDYRASGVTTLGYNAIPLGLYCWLYLCVKRKYVSWSFISGVIIGAIITLSTGRLTRTIVFILTFVTIYYYSAIFNKKNLTRFFLILFFIPFLGLGFYFFRFISSVQNSYLRVEDPISLVRDNLSLDFFSHAIIERGNMPNLQVLMKIVDSWHIDSDHLLGESFFYGIWNSFPGFIRYEGFALGKEVKQTWFLNAPGGNLPPTGIGEMYINFSYFGVPVGFFILGYFAAGFYGFVLLTKSFWLHAIYAKFLWVLILTYPKGESANFPLWDFFPIIALYLFLKIITQAMRFKRVKFGMVIRL